MKKSVFAVLFLLTTSLFSNELPNLLEKDRFVTITKSHLAFDSGWGMHEFMYEFEKTFDDSHHESQYITFVKKSPGIKEGDYLYIDADTYQSYNLRTRTWMPFSELSSD